MKFIQSRKTALTIIAVAIVYSLLAFVVLPAESFFAGDEGVKFIQAQSLLKYHYKSLFLSYPGQDVDPQNKFFPIAAPYAVEKGGRMYSQWPVLFPLISSLFFSVFGPPGLYVIPVLSSLLTLFVLSKMFRLLFDRDSILILLLLAFGTPVFFYSLVFWEHTLSVLLATVAVYLVLLSLKTPGYGRMLIAGLLLGLGIWVRNELYFFVLALLISGFVTRSMWKGKTIFPSAVYFLAGLFLVLVPMWVIQKATVGEMLGADVSQFIKAGVSTEASPFKANILYFFLYKIKLAAVLLFHRFDSEWMIALALPYIVFAWVMIFPKQKERRSLLIFSLAGMAAVSLFTLSQNLLNSGLLVNTPFLIFSLVALSVYQELKESGGMILFVLLTGLVYILLISLFAPATGGMQWGPRFMLPALPLLLVALGALWDNWEKLEFGGMNRRLAKTTLILLILVSLFIQIKGVQFLYGDREEGARLVAKVKDRPEIVFVTNNFWFPQETAAVYGDKKFYFVSERTDFEILAARLQKRRVRRFAFVTLSEPSYLGVTDPFVGFVRKERVRLPGSFWLESFKAK